MTDREKARADRLAALLEGDGTLIPAEVLPEGLLTEGRDELEALLPVLDAIEPSPRQT